MPTKKKKKLQIQRKIPAVRIDKNGDSVRMFVTSVDFDALSADLSEAKVKDKKFRLEIQLSNKNWLPVLCKRVKSKSKQQRVKFVDISRFETELLDAAVSFVEEDLLEIPDHEYGNVTPDEIFEGELVNV